MTDKNPHGGPNRGQGRKPIGDEPMNRHYVSLDAQTVRKARLLGDGNLSAGIRRAVKEAGRPEKTKEAAEAAARKAEQEILKPPRVTSYHVSEELEPIKRAVKEAGKPEKPKDPPEAKERFIAYY